jgi:hypothetical protein
MMPDDDIEAEPETVQLVPDDELRSAFRCVDGVKYRRCLDWLRDKLSPDTNAWKFLTALADKNPQKIISLVKECEPLVFVKWERIEKAAFSNPQISFSIISAVRALRAQVPEMTFIEARETLKKRYNLTG